ncbi:transposase, IS605 OrfB family protein [Natrinema versiforme JCM 10478]|uniref:Transposase, IS605 OrfB family protein n=1 Tax=Natrinema versiforme JCM 10478 TaxID=1227496 RepID=L9Y1E7_9EURY|nr:transposase, IS605 OrfB family protein [Natrinema versiforme JCM 10478]
MESVQQVRAVWTGEEWELHFVCKVEIEVAEVTGEKTVGVDLGINNFAALAYEDGHSELYPLNCLKQDDYYFSKQIARCDDSDSEQATRLNQKKSARRTHYFHTLSKHIVQRCVDEGVGTIVSVRNNCPLLESKVGLERYRSRGSVAQAYRKR